MEIALLPSRHFVVRFDRLKSHRVSLESFICGQLSTQLGATRYLDLVTWKAAQMWNNCDGVFRAADFDFPAMFSGLKVLTVNIITGRWDVDMMDVISELEKMWRPLLESYIRAQSHTRDVRFDRHDDRTGTGFGVTNVDFVA